MPMTEFRNGVLTGGLLKEFGDALARELNVTPRYLSFPRKRVEAALIGGQADLVCDLRPEWLDRKDWHWTASIFANNMIVASRDDTYPLPHIAALADRRVGTILGYRYQEVEYALGKQFLRDEALTDEINLNKLLTRRFEYLLTNSLYFDYQRKVHPERKHLNPRSYKITSFDTYCALPPHGKLSLAEVDRAIQAIKGRGDIQAILSRFRPAGN
ncbi:transporter substrate-binding domain-containing protein [Pseudoduganella sp. LjRoot289]|uniref:substrate-binding periplasmic protein n=1 Tax=Pseudoduganella sp. LjRoot289 TaxID=3342314 RepID=UPI003ECE3B0D